MIHEPISTKVYYIVYVVLLVLLALTVAAAYIDVGPWGFVVALTIAATKAVLVLLYFMHVRYSSRLTKIFAAAGFVWLGILIVLMMSDYLTRGWIN